LWSTLSSLCHADILVGASAGWKAGVAGRRPAPHPPSRLPPGYFFAVEENGFSEARHEYYGIMAVVTHE
jgi:hypothetical protein